jgi:carboxymethylenebutenolidase
VLESADGTRFGAYQGRPEEPAGAGVVILPDVRGLHRFYKELACRFAEAGLEAVAVDYFGRTAGIGSRDEDFPFREHHAQVDWGKIAEDTDAAAAWLRANTQATALFTVGFCFGGAMSWRQSATGTGLSGCVGFYGVPSRVADAVPRMRAPLLILAAGQDFTPVEEVGKFADQVRDTGVEAELHVYPDAPHSFFDRTFAGHAADCADAWERMLAFMARHS